MTHTQTDRGHLIGIIGAGPAGLYAAKKLVEAGAHVVLFNRDIKPGGLAEYGIFPTKHKMKEGLRKQFRRILAHPQVDYYGNCSVGEKGELTLADLQKLGFDALICAAGAQGTKSLGLPGEDAVGVVPRQRPGVSLQPSPAFQPTAVSHWQACRDHWHGQCDD